MKIAKLIALLAVAALCLAGCSSDEEEKTEVPSAQGQIDKARAAADAANAAAARTDQAASATDQADGQPEEEEAGGEQ